MTPAPRRAGLLGAAARAVAFVALAGALLATASVVPFGGLGLVVLAALVWPARTAGASERVALARPLAALVGSPALLGLPLLMSVDPVVSSTFRCGTSTVGLLLVFPVLAFFTGIVAAAIALGAVSVMPRLCARGAPVLRAAALLVGLALLGAGALRSVRFPAPEDWATSLPLAARIEAFPLPGASPDRASAPTAGRAAEERTLPLAGTAGHALSLACPEARCVARIVDGQGEWLAAAEAVSVGATVPLDVRTDERLGVVVLAQGGRALGALDVRTGRATDVSLHAVAAEVAPGLLALLAMAAGIGAGAARARRAAVERTALARLRVATTARVDDRGVVHPDDGGLPFRSPGASLPEGLAVIVARPAPGAFRSAPDRGTWVLAGDRAQHLAAHELRATRFDLESAAAVALGAGPLVAAALQGLVP